MHWVNVMFAALHEPMPLRLSGPVISPRLPAAAAFALGENIERCQTRSSPTPSLMPLIDRRSALLSSATCLAPSITWPSAALAAEDGNVRVKYFPGAKSSSAMDSTIWKALSARGYTKDNTLFGMSVCSDEVNFHDSEIIDLLKQRWGETFSLGGLAGLPFAGKAGLSAYAHHVPDEGKLFILFAPHVGVGIDGKVGALERDGIAETSSACGAAVGAFKVLSKPGVSAPNAVSDLADLQFEYIKLKLAEKLDGVTSSANELAFVTYQMYQMVQEAMLQQISAVPGIWDDCSELAVLGGIQINRFEGRGDAFQPLMFQTTTQTGKVTNLYPSTFGDLPELGSILGNSLLADKLLSARLA